MLPPPPAKRAFSLVELSIVLVVLGLLTGGILTGQNLIRAAELRSVTTEFQAYQTATMTFRDKYFALPGDMRNATDFWGSKGGTGSDDACYAVIATGEATCNGDGDGYTSDNGSAVATSALAERFLYWQHLANAGLIEGSYSGVTDSTTDQFVLTPGLNVPASRLNPGFWSSHCTDPSPGSADRFSHSGGCFFTLRKTVGASQATSPLSAEEMWGIDTKVDDGKPGLGRVMTMKNGSTIAPGCATTDDESTAEYAVQYTTNKCHFRVFAY